MAGKAPPAGLPQLSNEAQLEIMELVKKGMSLDEALTRAASMSESEAKMRSRSVRCSKKKKEKKKQNRPPHFVHLLRVVVFPPLRFACFAVFALCAPNVILFCCLVSSLLLMLCGFQMP